MKIKNAGKTIGVLLPLLITLLILTALLQPLYAFENNNNHLQQLRRRLQQDEFEMEVSEVSEGVTITSETDTQPRSLQAGELITEGSVINADSGNVSLSIPGISYLVLDTGTELKVDKLRSSQMQDITLNEVDLDMLRGQVQSRLRSHENVETDFQLKTPTAVAGIRGTSFQCGHKEVDGTSCSVLTGSLNFASRVDPARSRIVQARQRSSLLPGREEPDEPDEIAVDEEQQLSEFQQNSENRILRRPYAGGLQLNEDYFGQTGDGLYTIRYIYPEQKTLTLSGIAGTREDGAELESIALLINSEELEARGLETWETEITVEPPAEGEELTLHGHVKAHDSLVGPSRSYPFRITLYNPEREGVIPANLQEDEVPVEIVTIAGVPYEDVFFPFYLSGAQLPDEDILITGYAEAELPVLGVAYRLDAGEWIEAKGQENWSISLPAGADASFNIEIVAWTEETIGRPLSMGPIQYSVERPFPPFNYRQDDIAINVISIAGFGYDELRFPFHTYRPDLIANELILEGSAEADVTVEAVAYSIDGQNWQLADGNSNWQINLPASSNITYDQIQIVAWTVDGRIGNVYELNTINHANLTYNEILRRSIDNMFYSIENSNLSDVINHFEDDFYYQDSRSQHQLDYYDFRRFLRDFFSNTRNLKVIYDIDQLIAGPAGGEINYSLRWRGTDDNSNRPFVMFANDVSNDYIRGENGRFELQSFQDFPLWMYLYHRENIYMPDLGGIILETLQTSSNSDDVDIIAQTFDPALLVNTLSIGGDIEAGGIQRLSENDFSSVRSIPASLASYDDNVGIAVDEMFAVNIVKEWGKELTALIKVLDIRSDYVQVRVISARDIVDGFDRAVMSYRGVDPFE